MTDIRKELGRVIGMQVNEPFKGVKIGRGLFVPIADDFRHIRVEFSTSTSINYNSFVGELVLFLIPSLRTDEAVFQIINSWADRDTHFSRVELDTSTGTAPMAIADDVYFNDPIQNWHIFATLNTKSGQITQNRIDATTYKPGQSEPHTRQTLPGMRMVDLSADGMASDEAVLGYVANEYAHSRTIEARLVGQDKMISGRFAINSFSETGAQDGMATFSISLQSTGDTDITNF